MTSAVLGTGPAPARKKARYNRDEPEKSTPSREIPTLFARVDTMTIYDVNRPDTIFLNRYSFSQLFPGVDSRDSSTPHYVRIADRVFNVAIRRWEEGSSRIALQDTQVLDLAGLVDPNSPWAPLVMVNAVDSAEVFSQPLDHIEFEIEYAAEDTELGEEPISLDIEYFTRLVRERLRDCYLIKTQKVAIDHQKGPFVLRVRKCIFPNTSNVRHTAAQFGTITEKTSIRIRPNETERIFFVQEVDPSKIEAFEFKVSVVKGEYISWHKRTSSLPLILNPSKVRRRILQHLSGQSLVQDQTLELKYDGSWTFRITLDEVSLKETEEGDRQFQREYPLREGAEIRLFAAKHVVLPLEDVEATPAESMKFVVQQAKSHHTDDNRNNYVSVEELERKLREIGERKEFVSCQRIKVELSTGLYEVEVNHAQGGVETESEFHRRRWALTEKTQLRFRINGELGIKLVDTNRLYSLKELTLKVTRGEPDEQSDAFLMCGGEDLEIFKQIFVQRDHLSELVREEASHHLLKDQQLSVTTDEGDPLTLEVSKWTLAGTHAEGKKYGVLLELTSETKIKYDIGKNAKVSLLTEAANLNYANVNERMAALGLGGLSEQFKKIIRNILVSRGAARKMQRKLGIKPPRGLLLYGPPGTGKTTLARNIGKVFGCEEDRLQMISGPSILDKYLGASERKIRELFEPAVKSQDKYGEKSPLYVIVFDEIEAILGTRGAKDPKWHHSIVDQLLASMDGLKELNNILVIGITNFREALDPAALRSGRFEVHVGFEIPDKQGREEIFAIHMRKILKHKMLAGDVSIKKLVTMTTGFTGADIEGMVRKAQALANERFMIKLIEQGQDLGEQDFDAMSEDPEAKITLKDFKEAYKEMTENRADKLPEGMYL